MTVTVEVAGIVMVWNKVWATRVEVDVGFVTWSGSDGS